MATLSEPVHDRESELIPLPPGPDDRGGVRRLVRRGRQGGMGRRGGHHHVAFEPRSCGVVDFLITLMRMFVEHHDSGRVLGPEFQVRLGARRRRRVPDVLFVARARLEILRPNHLEGAPDLAMEIVSPDSVARDWREKYLDYQAAGVREYWVIDPLSRNVEAYSLAEGAYRRIEEADGRIASLVLPGFYLKPAWLWQEPLPKVRDVLQELGGVAMTTVELAPKPDPGPRDRFEGGGMTRRRRRVLSRRFGRRTIVGRREGGVNEPTLPRVMRRRRRPAGRGRRPRGPSRRAWSARAPTGWRWSRRSSRSRPPSRRCSAPPARCSGSRTFDGARSAGSIPTLKNRTSGVPRSIALSWLLSAASTTWLTLATKGRPNLGCWKSSAAIPSVSVLDLLAGRHQAAVVHRQDLRAARRSRASRSSRRAAGRPPARVHLVGPGEGPGGRRERVRMRVRSRRHRDGPRRQALQRGARRRVARIGPGAQQVAIAELHRVGRGGRRGHPRAISPPKSIVSSTHPPLPRTHEADERIRRHARLPSRGCPEGSAEVTEGGKVQHGDFKDCHTRPL